MILVGFLTRPVALAHAVMLAVTLWFHVTHPHGVAILSPAGMAAPGGNAALFTADGLRNLAAGGRAGFLYQARFKAEGLSALWTVATLLLAASAPVRCPWTAPF